MIELLRNAALSYNLTSRNRFKANIIVLVSENNQYLVDHREVDLSKVIEFP